MGFLLRMVKGWPTFFRHGRKLLGALALGHGRVQSRREHAEPPRGLLLYIPLVGVPYPLIEHGAHMRAFGHPDDPSPFRITLASSMLVPHRTRSVSMIS